MKRLLLILFLHFAVVSFSQTFTAKLISANGSAWGQTNHIEKTSKGNDVYIGEKDPSTFNTTGYPYIKARLAYLSNDKMGSCSIRSLQRTTFEEGSVITSDPSRYYRKTCLSESYDKDWLDWANETEKTNAININATYPAIVYAYSVADGDVYDVYFYVSDDSDPFVSGTCQKLFKVGPDEYEGIYEDLSGLAHWYFEDVSNLEEMFSQCGSLKKVGLSGDFSLVSSLKNMFYNCASIEEIVINGDFGAKLTTLEGVFANCTNLKSITLGGEFKNVTSINSLFKNCTSLEEMHINGAFTTRLTSASSVFEGCSSLESVSILKAGEVSDAKAQLHGNFSKVTTLANSFKNCTNLETATIKGDFSALTNASSLFYGCTELTSADIEFEKDALTTLSNMFRNCTSITSATIGEGDDADVMVKGNFSKVTTLDNLFCGCSVLEDVDIKDNFPLLTNVSSLFSNCTVLKTVDIDGTFSSLTSLASLLKNMKKLETAKIKGDFSALTNASSLFEGCSALTSAEIDFEEDALTTLANMFKNCTAITSATIGDGVDANVMVKGNFSALTNASSLFDGCSALTSAGVNFDENALTTLAYMFRKCTVLSDVALSGDFSSVTTIQEIFNNATNVSSVVLNDGDANFSSLTSVKDMVNYWPISKYDVFSSIMSQMRISSTNLPGATNDSHRVINNNKSGWTSKKVMTKNNAEYDVTNGYLATFLPIELTYFEVLQNGNDLFFEWETATETNNDFFTIEQSIDGVSFYEVARIAGAGTSSVSNLYDYTLSTSLNGLVYFRLKQTDYNGDYSYSNVIPVAISNKASICLYPTIASDYITIDGEYEYVEFCDEKGVIQHPHRAEGNTYPISSLPNGMHYAIISLRNGEIVTRQFFKNK